MDFLSLIDAFYKKIGVYQSDASLKISSLKSAVWMTWARDNFLGFVTFKGATVWRVSFRFESCVFLVGAMSNTRELFKL